MPTVAQSRPLIKPVERAKPLDYLPINRNLRSHPIARGERVKLEWRRNTRRGYRVYKLAGGVSVRLPLDCGLGRRHATGFDVAMLLTLTGLSIARGPSELAISNAELLHHMGVSAKSGVNRNKVAAALEFWQHATITWDRWYTPNPDRTMQRADRYAPLTIEHPILEASRGRVVLNKQWLKLATKYFAQLPPPLPVEAPVLNLLLLVMAWRRGFRQLRGGWVEKRFRSHREITARIGLDHRERNLMLPLIVEKLKWWFEARSGGLEMRETSKGVFFRCSLPMPKPPERVRKLHKRRRRAKWLAANDRRVGTQ